MSAIARLANTIITDYGKEVSNATERTHILFGQLKAKGQMIYKQAGENFTWPVQYRIHNTSGFTGYESQTFSPQNLWKTATLPTQRGESTTDSISLGDELAAQQEKVRLVQVVTELARRLVDTLNQTIPRLVYADGNATGSEKKWHGLESIFGINGTITENTTGATQRSANAADKYAYPSDTYANLSTILQNYSGSYLGTGTSWPNIKCTPDTDFWSPVIANDTSTAWTNTSGDTWLANCDEVMQEVLVHLRRNKKPYGSDYTAFHSPVRYNQFTQKARTKERIETTRMQSLVSVGIEVKQGFEWDGVLNVPDYDIESALSYILNVNDIKMRLMTGSLIDTKQAEDIDTVSKKYMAYNIGNMQITDPRCHAKVYGIA